MRHPLFVIVLMLPAAVLMGSCGATAAPATPAPTALATTVPTTPAPSATAAQVEGWVMMLERSGGLAGTTESWAVYDTGRVVTSHGGVVQLPAEQVRTVMNALTGAGFFDWNDEYGSTSTCNDCNTFVLTLVTPEKTKTVSAVLEAQDTPANVRAAIELVHRLVSGVGEN